MNMPKFTLNHGGKLPRPPAHLSASSKRWFKQVAGEFELEEHHFKLLIGCCEALDRAAEARKAVENDGAYMTDRFGAVRKHPGLAVERDAMITFARLLRELNLDTVAPEPPRPPGVGGRR